MVAHALACLNKKQARLIGESIIEQQREALHTRDVELWKTTLSSGNDIADSTHAMWFTGYVTRFLIKTAEIITEQITLSGDAIVAQVLLHITYVDYDPVQETWIYRIAFVPELDTWRIVWMTKQAPDFPSQSVQLHSPFALTFRTQPPAQLWWQNKTYLSLLRNISEPLAPEAYARAINGTVRFREMHTEIECAAILANLMSTRVAELAAQIVTPDPLQLLANLYYAAQDRLTVAMVQEDRSNMLESKLHFPWFGFDELLARKGNAAAHITALCPVIMTLYTAILRLGGYRSQDVLQVRLYNHDALLVTNKAGHFFVGPDQIIALTTRSFYYLSRIYKLFTDTHYWSTFGLSNIPSEAQAQFSTLIQQSMPNFQFERRERVPVYPLPLYETVLDEGVFPGDPLARSQFAKRRIFELSQQYPYAPFTWARYAYQSLYVQKPETYALWAIKSPAVLEAWKKYSSLAEVLAAMQTFGTTSIFCEDERLMVAEQVLRYKTGNAQARALLLFTIYKHWSEGNGCVLITEQAAYCLWRDGTEHWTFWDALTLRPVDQPEGRILLAFDEKESYYPLLGEATNKTSNQHPAAWRHLVEQR